MVVVTLVIAPNTRMEVVLLAADTKTEKEAPSSLPPVFSFPGQ